MFFAALRQVIRTSRPTRPDRPDTGTPRSGMSVTPRQERQGVGIPQQQQRTPSRDQNDGQSGTRNPVWQPPGRD